MKKVVICVILFIFFLFLMSCRKKEQAYAEPVTGAVLEETKDTEWLSIHYLDVGQGDSTLISCGGEYMLIDGGDDSCGSFIRAYLKEQGVERLKYVVATHPDADHIGGLDNPVYYFGCDTFIAPDIKNDTRAYDNLMGALKEKEIKIAFPVQGTRYSLGDAEFEIVSPGKPYEAVNDCSVCIKLVYGDTSFLFLGDAQEEEQADMIGTEDLKADVLKVSHHGSCNGTSRKLLEDVIPEYAVISCGKDNDYGHPHKSVMATLREAGMSVFRTDEQGTIIAMSDGRHIVWNRKPSKTWAYGIPRLDDKEDEIKEEPVTRAAEEYKYIGNSSSMKFHRSSCEFAESISEHNRVWSNDRNEFLNNGYAPCKACRPEKDEYE